MGKRIKSEITESIKISVDSQTQHEKNLWKIRGIDDVYFQKEIMVNFWTIMGGIAVGALLTQLSSLRDEVLNGRWYLLIFFVNSILIISNSWIQSAWGSLVLHWPITVPGTLIFFLGLICLCIQNLLITDPTSWMAASSGVVFFSILMQHYFQHHGAWEVFSQETINRLKSNIKLYYIFLIVTLVAVIHLILDPSPAIAIFWGLISFGSSILALVLQHKGMQHERKELGIP